MVNRRTMLTTMFGGALVASAGCSRSRSVRSLSLGLIRVVNLRDASVDVQLTLSPSGDETKVQREETLVEFGSTGEAEADQLVYRPDSRPSVSKYDYALAIDGDLKNDLGGEQIVESVSREYDDDACLMLHYYLDELTTPVGFSHELYPACDLPE